MLREISNTTLIEELIGLFDNPKVKKLLLESYLLSQKENKVLSDAVFEQLFYFKKANPNINIIIDPNIEGSRYSLSMNTIYLKNNNVGTFFHELTHLLSYENSKFIVPNEWIDLKNKFLASPKNISLAYSFIKWCNLEKMKIMFAMYDKQEVLESITKKNEEKSIPKNSFEHSKKDQTFNIESETIGRIEDIIDAIFAGKSSEDGIVYIKGRDYNKQKAPKTDGHGCEYFKSTEYNFEETIAQYLAIKLTDPNNELFVMLKNILGNEFVLFLEQRCNEISGIYYTINNNLTMK